MCCENSDTTELNSKMIFRVSLSDDAPKIKMGFFFHHDSFLKIFSEIVHHPRCEHNPKEDWGVSIQDAYTIIPSSIIVCETGNLCCRRSAATDATDIFALDVLPSIVDIKQFVPWNLQKLHRHH